MRVAIVKPDWGLRGGGEIAVDHVARLLAADGHTVVRRPVSIPTLGRRPYGLDVLDDAWGAAPEYFGYVSVLEAVERVDTSGVDLVVSTQPPSYAVDHPRHLSIFFHHARVFYDLCDLYLDAGFVDRPDLHRAARDRVRALDQSRLDGVDWFCPISGRVAERLRRFNGITRSSVLHFGVGVGREAPPGARAEPGRGEVLCVSRSEFPKRTELFVHALKYLPHRRGALVGTGGRLPWVQAVDTNLTADGVDLDAAGPAELWCNRGEWAPGEPPPGSNVSYPGRVGDADLVRRYADAPCVVAPAYDEDYGLTALEAMAHGRPVVTCSDGGGLTAFVEDGVNGFVVAPTGRAIADAVERISNDSDLARRLGEGALATAADFTWDRCAGELRLAVDRVMSG